jgi:hypothetical protein
MIARTFLTCVLAALHLTASAAIQFSVIAEERSLEGIKFKVLYFKDGARKILYQAPRGWSVAGDSSGLKMTPPDLAQAQGDVSQSPLPAPQAFDAEVMKALQQKAVASAPAGSLKVAVVSEEKSPVKVNGNDTYAVTISYEAFGQEFLMSLLYLNLPETQVCFRATARKPDFEKVHGAMRNSIITWQWVDPPAPPKASSLTVAK